MGTSHYQDSRIGIVAPLNGVDPVVAHMDADLEKDDCFEGTNPCEPGAVFTVGMPL
jgi:hypothetical protein